MDETVLTFTVPTYETQVFTADVKYVDMHPDGGYTWAGEIQSIGKGDIVLTVIPGEAPSGFIRLTGKYYSISGLSESLALLVKHNLSSYNKGCYETLGETPFPPPTEGCNPAAFVDILILETPDARTELNLFPPSYLTNAFANINFILFQSSVPNSYVRFQRHYATYNPIGGCDPFLIQTNDFTSTNQTLINLRNQYKADAVIILTTCLDGAGGFSIQGLNPSKPYGIVDMDYVMGPRFSLAHEFGHMFGARHNRLGNDEGDEPTNGTIYHGLYFIDSDQQEQWTIMAKEPGLTPRILHYSNPGVLYNNVATGSPIDNNSLAAIGGTCSMSENISQPPPELSVLILGKKTLCTEKPEFPQTFTAFVNGPSPGPGMGPFNYEWRWSKNMFTATNPEIVVGGNNPNLILNAPNTCEGKYYLKVTVTNPLFSIVRERVDIIDPALCTTCPDLRDNLNEVSKDSISLSVIPNPVIDFATIKYQCPPLEQTIVEIIRTDGQIILSRSILPSGNLEEIEINLQSFPSGLYTVRIIQSSNIESHLFSIAK